MLLHGSSRTTPNTYVYCIQAYCQYTMTNEYTKITDSSILVLYCILLVCNAGTSTRCKVYIGIELCYVSHFISCQMWVNLHKLLIATNIWGSVTVPTPRNADIRWIYKRVVPSFHNYSFARIVMYSSVTSSNFFFLKDAVESRYIADRWDISQTMLCSAIPSFDDANTWGCVCVCVCWSQELHWFKLLVFLCLIYQAVKYLEFKQILRVTCSIHCIK